MRHLALVFCIWSSGALPGAAQIGLGSFAGDPCASVDHALRDQASALHSEAIAIGSRAADIHMAQGWNAARPTYNESSRLGRQAMDMWNTYFAQVRACNEAKARALELRMTDQSMASNAARSYGKEWTIFAVGEATHASVGTALGLANDYGSYRTVFDPDGAVALTGLQSTLAAGGNWSPLQRFLVGGAVGTLMSIAGDAHADFGAVTQRFDQSTGLQAYQNNYFAYQATFGSGALAPSVITPDDLAELHDRLEEEVARDLAERARASDLTLRSQQVLDDLGVQTCTTQAGAAQPAVPRTTKQQTSTNLTTGAALQTGPAPKPSGGGSGVSDTTQGRLPSCEESQIQAEIERINKVGVDWIQSNQPGPLTTA